MDFQHIYKEPILGPLISTGAAGGFSHEETLLNGIYEIVERDAFMTTYLNKIAVQKVDIRSLQNSTIQKTIASCFRYKLDPYVFNITNDLGIPSFMTILIDRTGIGPAVSVGLKSGLNSVGTIIGSLTEALQIRISIRNRLLQDRRKRKITEVKTIDDRAYMWSSTKMIHHLNYLLLLPATEQQNNFKNISTFKVKLSIIYNIQIFII